LGENSRVHHCHPTCNGGNSSDPLPNSHATPFHSTKAHHARIKKTYNDQKQPNSDLKPMNLASLTLLNASRRE